MTVFINGRFATQPLSGVQRYAGEMLRALDDRGRVHAEEEYVLLSPPGAPQAALRYIEQRWIKGGSGHAWEQVAFALEARDGVALSLAMSGPVRHPRQLVVVHDAAVHRCPEHFSWRYAAAHRVLERQLAKRAQIATVSEFSRRELAAVLGLDEREILVAPNGADHRRGLPDTGIVERMGLRETPFFLAVGNFSTNKNLAVVVRAFERIEDLAVRLVVVGQPQSAIFGTVRVPFDDRRLIFAGRLPDEAVAGLLREARALVFPSRYEGFGLPPLEAMAAGCPVLASDCAAVLETCGGAAEHFGPDNDELLAKLMMRAIEDDAWRTNRMAKGMVRATRYRWADSAALIAGECAALGMGMAVAA